MNSALKPVLPSSASQNPPVTSQLNKPMHPQGTQSNYGQPTSHMPQSLVNLPHNPTVAHSHPNPAHQTNHYSLNVPNAPQHYSTSNPSAIPASNHPVANITQTSVGQSYSPNKNVPFSGGYQPNLGHPPNQNPIPPVSQSLPATQLIHPAPVPVTAETTPDKPQSNGTAEVKSPAKSEPQENHVSRDKSPAPPSSPKPAPQTDTALPDQQKQQETPTPPQESEKSPEPKTEVTTVTTVSSSPSTTSNEPSNENVETASVETTESEPKPETVSENSEAESQPEPMDTSNSNTEVADVPETTVTKTKEKEQKNTTPPAKTTPIKTRKSKTPKSDSDSPKSSKNEPKTPAPQQKSPTFGTKSKRTRTKTQPYQSPLPEIEIITKISSSTPRSKTNDDKLIVFYKNEFLAVRNSEGSFYICQAVQNIYKSSPKIRIRWLSQDKSDKSGEVYTPDFYDNTDFDCILTNLNLVRVDKGRYRLPPAEKERTDSILKRSLAVEKGEVTSPSLTEEHPDGIDLSLYKEESQLKKRKGTKRRASALRSARKSNNTTKSPDQPKVRKVVGRAAKKAVTKRTALASKLKKSPPATSTMTVVTPTAAGTATVAVTPVEIRKLTTATSRMDRAKRRSDNQNHNNKVSPVVDQKKARVLAKVARKGAVNTNRSQSAKNAKAPPKATPSSSKVQKPTPKAATKKTKRSSRK